MYNITYYVNTIYERQESEAVATSLSDILLPCFPDGGYYVSIA